jgi:hypothetical protein
MQSNYRLPVGGLVAKSIGIYFGNLVPFVVLALVTLAPWIVFRFYLEANPPPVRRDDPLDVSLMPLLGMVLQMLGQQVLAGALTFGVVQRLRGIPTDLGQVLSVGVKSFLRVLVVGIVYGVLVAIGFVFLVVPGLMLLTIFFVALPAAVLENKGLGGAMQRSSELTRGNRWPILGALLLFGVVMWTVMMVFWFTLAQGADIERLPAWIEVVYTVVLAPFGATMPAVCYYMLRMGKENVDAKQIAAVFD